ncbi:MAG: hypothetical protein HY481_01090 [Candidatus Vogelbacteria bacterium]|nr:hypothetical protein [Candidatus Vogelbacteria bacterium]
MQKLKEFSRFAIAVIAIGLGVGYVLAAWSPPGFPPPTGTGSPDADAPINVGNKAQTKSGPLAVTNTFISPQIFAGKLGIDDGIGNDGPVGNPDPFAVLDVDGLIRIRGGSPGPDRFLKTSSTAGDTTGLASWQPFPAGLASLKEGFGIDLCDYGYPDIPGTDCSRNEITDSGVITVAAGQWGTALPAAIQQRVDGGTHDGGNFTCPSAKAMTEISVSGLPTCMPFVTTVQAAGTSGLTLTAGGPPTQNATSGAITLAVNVGAAADNTGLKINTSNQVALNVDSVNAGDGLTISSNLVKFESCGASANQTWKYDGAKWGCASFPSPVPGGSVMDLKLKGSLAGDPSSCPAAPWTEAPRGDGLTYTSQEGVGGAGSGQFNKVRVCYRTDRACQVIYLRSKINPPPACPSSWTQADSTGEFAPGGVLTNYVRTCYLCN